MDEGVLVLLQGGVFAISGETGEELWSYYGHGRSLIGNVSSDGEYVVLYDEEESRTVLLRSSTGEIVGEFDVDLSEIDYTRTMSPDHLAAALAGVSGDTWVVRREDSVDSYDLATGDQAWTASDVPSCPDVGQVDSLTVQSDVVVAATTCFEQPEDRDSVVHVQGWDFTSELVGLDPDTGEELWRVEHSVGRSPFDSLERTIEPRPGGFVYIDFHYPYPPVGYSVLDIEAQEAIHLETQSLLWTSPEGSHLGLWDLETGEYQVQDRSGNVERTLELDTLSMSDDMVTDGLRVGLEGGVLYLTNEVADASASEGFARFEGFEDSATFTWDREESLSVTEALSVPGAVAVAYRAGDTRGVMGLR
ncbi:PQQ-binding-like beta-propeller repeat protein [Nocardiopsis aegyptia]|uniref:outer membrane protein assembly factor BamB family protein n=1 Tax=Nocardiopsis aegyptia TaxID=220378 RepID=UPI0036702C6A